MPRYDQISRPQAAARPLSAVDTFAFAAAGILPVAVLLWIVWLAAVWLTRGV